MYYGLRRGGKYNRGRRNEFVPWMACVVDGFAEVMWPVRGPVSMVPTCKVGREKMWKMVMLKGSHKRHNVLREKKVEKSSRARVGYVGGVRSDDEKGKILAEMCRKLFKRVVFKPSSDPTKCELWTRGK